MITKVTCVVGLGLTVLVEVKLYSPASALFTLVNTITLSTTVIRVEGLLPSACIRVLLACGLASTVMVTILVSFSHKVSTEPASFVPAIAVWLGESENPDT